jgi:hypothetical protein
MSKRLFCKAASFDRGEWVIGVNGVIGNKLDESAAKRIASACSRAAIRPAAKILLTLQDFNSRPA